MLILFAIIFADAADYAIDYFLSFAAADDIIFAISLIISLPWLLFIITLMTLLHYYYYFKLFWCRCFDAFAAAAWCRRFDFLLFFTLMRFRRSSFSAALFFHFLLRFIDKAAITLFASAAIISLASLLWWLRHDAYAAFDAADAAAATLSPWFTLISFRFRCCRFLIRRHCFSFLWFCCRQRHADFFSMLSISSLMLPPLMPLSPATLITPLMPITFSFLSPALLIIFFAAYYWLFRLRHAAIIFAIPLDYAILITVWCAFAADAAFFFRFFAAWDAFALISPLSLSHYADFFAILMPAIFFHFDDATCWFRQYTRFILMMLSLMPPVATDVSSPFSSAAFSPPFLLRAPLLLFTLSFIFRWFSFDAFFLSLLDTRYVAAALMLSSSFSSSSSLMMPSRHSSPSPLHADIFVAAAMLLICHAGFLMLLSSWLRRY